MQSALAASSLAKATSDAQPLGASILSLLASQCPQMSKEAMSKEDSAASDLPAFDDLVAALGVPPVHASAPPATARLPVRLVSSDPGVSPLEQSLWAAYSANGVHELLSHELITGLADRVKAAISCCELHDLAGRSDLNGERAVVIGPLTDGGRVPVRVSSTGECLRARPINVFEGDGLPCVLEVGAGSGALAHFLARALAGYASVAACDDGSAFGTGRRRVATGTPPEHRLSHGDVEVQALSTEAALEALSPKVVLASWHPSGLDWTGLIRACPSVSTYILLGEADSSTCGDAWATWGILPQNWYEYGLDEDSLPPYVSDGFVRQQCEEVARWQICRFDSHAARGFSTASLFVRLSALEAQKAAEAEAAAEETLEQSWARMQKSVQAGRAQRLDVEMDMRVTPTEPTAAAAPDSAIHCDIVHESGCGFGLRANRDLAQGTTVFTESPIHVLTASAFQEACTSDADLRSFMRLRTVDDSPWDESQWWPERIRATSVVIDRFAHLEFAKLTASKQQRWMSLVDSHSSASKTPGGVVRSNAFTDASTGDNFLFGLLSRANHSCAPNMARSFVGVRAKVTMLHAACSGDNLHISYLADADLARPTAERRALLRERFNFFCECKRCGTAVGAGAASPTAPDFRAQPLAIDATVVDGCRGIDDALEAARAAVYGHLHACASQPTQEDAHPMATAAQLGTLRACAKVLKAAVRARQESFCECDEEDDYGW